MRLVTTTALIVGMLGFSGMALAQQQQQCKVALVNMQALITGSNEGKAASAKYDALVKEWKQKLDSIQKEISDTELKLKGQNGAPNQVSIAALQRTLVQQKFELSEATRQAQKNVDRYLELLLTPVQLSAIETPKQVAAEKGITAVIDSSSPTTTAPSNGDAKCDITAEVLKRMNAKFSSADPSAK